MELKIYETIQEIIGVLPPELSWVYGLATCLFLFLLFFLVSYPFVIIFSLGRRW